MSGPGPLAGLRVLDFSIMLPGPLATLMLAAAGADVVKVEPPQGEAGRGDPAVFAMLNRGKRSIAIDLKRERDRLMPMVAAADVIVEQFRPGVMDRLGLGAGTLRARNPRLIYVSINGYGMDGPDALRPGHDLTYSAEAGLLSLAADRDGAPVLPAALAADIGTGYAAVVNVLLALLARARTGAGAHVVVRMIESVMPFLNEAIAHAGEGRRPSAGYSPATGGSPRYALYRTADRRHLAVASPEEKFWAGFCAAAGLPINAERDAVSARIAERAAADWLDAFARVDCCVSLVMSVAEALASDRVVRILGGSAAVLPVGIDPALRAGRTLASAPALGTANYDPVWA